MSHRRRSRMLGKYQTFQITTDRFFGRRQTPADRPVLWKKKDADVDLRPRIAGCNGSS